MERDVAITDSNLGPVVSLLSWIMVATVLIAVTIKFSLASFLYRKSGVEDITLFLATLFSIGFTVALSIAARYGVGRHQNTLSKHELKMVQKAIYSTDISFILVSGFVQISVLLFLHSITIVHLHHNMIRAVGAIVLASSILYLFLALFPCHVPHVWEMLGNRCLNQPAIWEAFGSVNIVIEIALVALPVIMIYPAKIDRPRKTLVISYFAARIFVMAPFAAQIYQAHVLAANRYDRTFVAWKYYVAVIFVQGSSIITVCIPHIRNLLLGMESGMIQMGDLGGSTRRNTETEMPHSGSEG